MAGEGVGSWVGGLVGVLVGCGVGVAQVVRSSSKSRLAVTRCAMLCLMVVCPPAVLYPERVPMARIFPAIQWWYMGAVDACPERSDRSRPMVGRCGVGKVLGDEGSIAQMFFFVKLVRAARRPEEAAMGGWGIGRRMGGMGWWGSLDTGRGSLRR